MGVGGAGGVDVAGGLGGYGYPGGTVCLSRLSLLGFCIIRSVEKGIKMCETLNPEQATIHEWD